MQSAEAHARLQQFGLNEIQTQRTASAWKLLLGQFRSPLVLILIFAAGFSAFLGENIEAYAIAAIIGLNAFIGFLQEYRAEGAIAALKKMTAPQATVLRDGERKSIPAREIVPGDLLFLGAGDVVAADARLQQSAELQINESVLTGESVPVRKSAQNEGGAVIFMGTTVVGGTAAAEVTATGMKTEFGKIARLITEAESEPTPLQTQLHQVSKRLLLLCLGVVAVVIALALKRSESWIDLVIFSVSLAVAAVPEGLPAIVTVALSLGIRRMAKRKALIRKLPSIETLGCVSVICTDKTGTLTVGKMQVREIWGADHDRVLKVAAACCDPPVKGGVGDPTETAILESAAARGIHLREIDAKNPRIRDFPFDSERKRMSIFRQDKVLYVKGAFDKLIELCKMSAEKRNAAVEAHDRLTGNGLRVLAVATGHSEQESDLQLVGLIGMADPPRPEVISAIRETREAGILPIMITGDHLRTATAIAHELKMVDIGDPIAERVHARATPEDKLRLIREWKNRGHVVAMTGDGVNDAPALREAHVGIAMGVSGTEVTRQAADLVLADDNFATIVAAIEEGRNVYRNIKKAIIYLLTGNLGEVAVVLGASAFGLPVPFLAMHLLWINLVTDALPALTLIADPLSPDTMKSKPRPAREPLLGRAEWSRIFIVGGIEAAVVLYQFHSVLALDGIVGARNLAFTTLVFSQLLRSFGARSARRIFWEVGALSNLWLLGVAIFSGFLQLSLHYFSLSQSVFGLRALTLEEVLRCIAFALIPITLIELKKLIFNRNFGKMGPTKPKRGHNESNLR